MRGANLTADEITIEATMIVKAGEEGGMAMFRRLGRQGITVSDPAMLLEWPALAASGLGAGGRRHQSGSMTIHHPSQPNLRSSGA